MLSVGNCFVFMILSIYLSFTLLTASEYLWAYVVEVIWSLNIVLIIFVTTIFGQLVKNEVKTMNIDGE